MDNDRFDVLTRVLARELSRRGALVAVAALTGVQSVPIQMAAAKKKRRKKKKKQSAPRTISCLDPSRPNVCARTNSCLPACAPDKAFDPATCRCRCLDRHYCCECRAAASGSEVSAAVETELCFNFPLLGEAKHCEQVCQQQGLASSRFVTGRAECSTEGPVCTTLCSDDP